jgi:catechol 2,3-dioxygenase-like lactoylglutathione lyase family enzyme
MLLAIDHIQLAMPPAGEAAARTFFVGLLGMSEEDKPQELKTRGGCWFRGGKVHIHCGVESPFQPQRKAHPAILVTDLDSLAQTIGRANLPIRWDDTVPGRKRFYTDDPFGNRIEFIAAGNGFSEHLQPLMDNSQSKTI